MNLRVLIVEDSADDAKLLVRLLTKEGFEVTSQRVDTAEAMQAALEGATWDVVLADHTMPEFSALGALDTLKHTGLDLPFIIVSGLIGEDVAVAAMKAGAHDYIRKNNMTRLAPAIRRELHEAVVRRERRQAVEALEQLNAELEQRVTERTALLEAANQELRQVVAERERAEAALRESEEEYRATFEQAAVGVAHVGLDGRFLRVNHQLCSITGYSARELTGLRVQDITYSADTAVDLDMYDRLRASDIPTYSVEKRYVRKDGSLVWVGVTSSLLREPSKPRHFINIVEDIDQRKRSEEELRKLSAAVEQSPSAVLITDTQARIEYVNPKFTELTGYTAEEVKGQNPRFLKSGRTSQHEYLALWDTITSGRMWRGHFCNKKKNGELYWESASISPIVNAEGTITHFVAVKQDITERKAAEAERERLLAVVQRQAAELDTIITSIADMVVIYDAEGKIVRLNSTAEHMLGYSQTERNLTLTDRAATLKLATPEGRPVSPEETPAVRALQGETVNGIVMRLERRNHCFWIIAGAAPLRASDKLVGAVVTMSDITALHELQEQHEEYVSLVSHDLRSPLSAMLGQADLLRQRMEKQGLTQEAQIAAAVVKSAKRMNTMIQELVDSARLEAGRLELSKKPTDLPQLVADVIDRTVNAEGRGRVVLEPAPAVPPVMVDGERIERVISNLLSNALKYSGADSPVSVRIDRHGDTVALCVTDRGVGISAEDIPHLFQRFYRAKTAQRHEGLGLGLYISRLIVEAHGGSIRAESKVGEGSTFRLVVPLA